MKNEKRAEVRVMQKKTISWLLQTQDLKMGKQQEFRKPCDQEYQICGDK